MGIRILSVFGTRPEAIKMAPVIWELQKYPDRIESRVCVTAQHREMLDQVLGVFRITPDIDLNLMQPAQTLPELTTRVVAGITEVLERERPDCVLVQGDTTTVMATALAAFYRKVPVGHIEAGLRTYDRYSPFPEEINRRITDVLATFCFAPTRAAAEALRREGISDRDIYVTGNTVIDALLWAVRQPEPPDVAKLASRLDGQKLVLVTAHRRENFGAPLEEICLGLRELARRNPQIAIVYPVHLNPNVQEPVHRILQGEERIYLISPLSYLSFAHLMNRADVILTDSGGIQEEAPALGKPVLVVREETERPEAIEAGVAKLVEIDAHVIVQEVERLLYDEQAYRQMANAVSPFGDGHAAERIVRILLERLK
ncbi:MAG TPA: UDP-N-acetylglucosamine 2-epimerase (non-hydrolyzing) [Thermoflexia bacterium]|jgi:UDP-N-acetylglucosamine 2-epimerase (non-hydrolysing)|nr:UDP-N-acetylglucosamine 2-epimerase (non-hydrolyzing) [Thermoflexia bacterium]